MGSGMFPIFIDFLLIKVSIFRFIIYFMTLPHYGGRSQNDMTRLKFHKFYYL